MGIRYCYYFELILYVMYGCCCLAVGVLPNSTSLYTAKQRTTVYFPRNEIYIEEQDIVVDVV